MELFCRSGSLAALPMLGSAVLSAAFRPILPFSLPIPSPRFGCLIPSVRNVSSAVLVYGSRGHRDEVRYEEEDVDEFEEVVGEFLDDEASDDGLKEAEGDDDEVIDADALEEEARRVFVEYSKSLSRELKLDDGGDEQKEADGRRRRKKQAIRSIIPDDMLPKVAIVGRPNVGKSALFNRLVGGNRAIVVDEPGVTRDRLYGRSSWGDCEFMVVDTGGVLTISKSQANVLEDLAITTTIGMDGIPLASREAAVAKMPSMIERQATTAVEEAQVIIFLVDGQVHSLFVGFFWKFKDYRLHVKENC